jgi:hypothetical protein
LQVIANVEKVKKKRREGKKERQKDTVASWRLFRESEKEKEKEKEKERETERKAERHNCK